MSPWSIVVETSRVTLKPLLRIAIVMAVIMLLPDSGFAAAIELPVAAKAAAGVILPDAPR